MWLLCALVVLAHIVVALAVPTTLNSAGFGSPSDEMMYDNAARFIAGYPSVHSQWPQPADGLGVSAFIAAVYVIFGPSVVAGRLAMNVFAVLTAWFVYDTGRRVWGPKQGLLAAAITSFAPMPLYWTSLALKEAPVITTLVGFAWALTRWSERPTWRLAALSAFFLYLLSLNRPGLPLALAAAAAMSGLFLASVRWRQRVRAGVVIGALTMGALLVPPSTDTTLAFTTIYIGPDLPRALQSLQQVMARDARTAFIPMHPPASTPANRVTASGGSSVETIGAGLVQAALGPAPWTALELGLPRVTLVELGLWYLALALAAYGVVRSRSNSLALVAGLVALVVFLSIGSTHGNFGTLLRHRPMLWLFAALFASHGLVALNRFPFSFPAHSPPSATRSA